MKKLILILTVLSLLSVISAEAVDLAGYYVPSVPFVRYERYIGDPDYSVDFDPCYFGFGVKAMHHFTNVIGVEGAISHLHSYKGGLFDTKEYSIKRWNFNLGGIISPISGKFEPYANFGAALAYVAFIYTPDHNPYDNSGFNLGIYSGGGFRYDITDKVFIDFNPIYTFIANPKDHEDDFFREGGFLDIWLGVGFGL